MKSEYDHHLSRCGEECIFSFFAPSSFIRNLLYSFHLVYLILSKIVSKTYIFFFLVEIKSHRYRLYVELRKLEKKRVICWLVESLNLVFTRRISICLVKPRIQIFFLGIEHVLSFLSTICQPKKLQIRRRNKGCRYIYRIKIRNNAWNFIIDSFFDLRATNSIVC